MVASNGTIFEGVFVEVD